MAGRKKKDIFLRDGIYYARVGGHRWSTETGNEQEAYRRKAFMDAKKQPWSELKDICQDTVVITIDPEGNTFSKLITHYADPIEAMKKLGNSSKYDGKMQNTSEPPKDCLDIERLLDYEYALKESSDMPEKTLLYYRQRYDGMKRFLREKKADLSTFTKMIALEYPQYRLVETIRRVGLGFNNRKASSATVNKEIKHFRRLWDTWKSEGRISENPWTRVPLLKDTGDESELEIEPFTFDEVTAIIENIDDMDIRAACIWQCMLGSRPGLETLKINSKSIEANKIWNAKKRRWDVFYYSDEAKSFFATYLDGKTETLTTRKIREAFKKACTKAGVRDGKPYDLRHWFGTESLIENKLEVVQLMMRHREVKTTQVYAKVRKTAMAQAQEKMQRMVFEKMVG